MQFYFSPLIPSQRNKEKNFMQRFILILLEEGVVYSDEQCWD